jgi:uncharacterized protein
VYRCDVLVEDEDGLTMSVGEATESSVADEGRVGPPWRVALVWVGLVAVWAATGQLNRYVLEPNLAETPRHAALGVVTGAAAVGLIVAARRLLDRRSVRSLGVGSPAIAARHLLFGAAYWLTLAAVGLGVGMWLGWLEVTVAAPGAAALLFLLLRAALVFVFEAFPEELAFRGYLYANLCERLGTAAAVVLQAVLFTGWAFAFVALAEALGARADWVISADRAILFVTFGLILGLLRAISGSIWIGVGFHLAFQTVSQLHAAGEAGVLQVREQAANTLNVVSFWFFPVVVGALLLLPLALRRRGRLGA